ncbi:vitamin K epoxide reductase family protein [Pontibacter sp. MBLB2868]|uniref:vitamin K epoxide reductase family protein n=1 Tax=Pontibacter sp. MBLB2868 TaxID=3451555 RepID=UPI003F755727
MTSQTTVIDKIRKDDTTATQMRREIAALSAVGLVDFSLISLFQMGYIKKLPDIPAKIFDTHKVNTSKDAVLFGMPDGVISLGGYAGTMFLAMAATRFRKQSRLLDVAMGGIVLGQAAGAAQYMVHMATKQKRICIYCLTGMVINFSSVVSLYKLFKNRD